MAGRHVTDVTQKLVIILMNLAARRVAQVLTDVLVALIIYRTVAADLANVVNLVARLIVTKPDVLAELTPVPMVVAAPENVVHLVLIPSRLHLRLVLTALIYVMTCMVIQNVNLIVFLLVTKVNHIQDGHSSAETIVTINNMVIQR